MERYCDLAEGEMLGEWVVVKLLGEGAFASVYKCKRVVNENEEIRAIKVYQHGSQNIDYYVNEVRNFNRFDKKIKSGGMRECNNGSINTHNPILQSHGTFAHVISRGTTVRIHPCLIMSMGGPDIHQLIRYYRKEKSSSMLAMDVQMIMKDVLTGLKFIHNLGMIHTDIKPDNILMNCSLEEGIQNGFRVVIADLGSTTRAKKLFSKTVGTQEYCAPECLMSDKFTSAIDIWATFTMYYEMIVGEYLFDPHSECDIKYGEDIDEDLALFTESRHPHSDNHRSDNHRSDNPHSNNHRSDNHRSENHRSDNTIENTIENTDLVTGGLTILDDNDSDYESDQEDDDSSEEDENDSVSETTYFHLLIMTKILGPAPRCFSKNKDYFDLRRRLKHNPVVEKIDIADLMMLRIHLSYDVCKQIETFLLNGICWHPDDRISAENALKLPWLDVEYETLSESVHEESESVQEESKLQNDSDNNSHSNPATPI